MATANRLRREIELEREIARNLEYDLDELSDSPLVAIAMRLKALALILLLKAEVSLDDDAETVYVKHGVPED